MKKSLYSLSKKELEDLVLRFGEKKFRAKQIRDALYDTRVIDISDLRLLPENLRNKLEEEYQVFDMQIIERQISKKEAARKYLIKTEDSYYIECVLMKYKHGYSLCVSSQVGCRMACSFCASGKNGLFRNLTFSEMLQQYALVKKDIGEKISNIVLMGIGEPLDNYKDVLEFIRQVTSENGFNVSVRNITLSTCGLANKIRELADEKLGITLAVSLHFTQDEERNINMPINKLFNLKELLSAVDYYFQKTSRRVTIEYSLISGVNDSEHDANRLIRLLSGRIIHVNLIPINEIEGSKQKASSKKYIKEFSKRLSNAGINVSVRRSLADDISGACGQLVTNINKKHDK